MLVTKNDLRKRKLQPLSLSKLTYVAIYNSITSLYVGTYTFSFCLID